MTTEHEPVCPPESRCVICWDDDDAVIKALVAERDKLRPIVEELVTYAGGMEYDDWRMFVQRAQEALNP